MEDRAIERAESLEQLRALENGVRVHVLVTKHGSPGVDTPADVEAVAGSLGAISSYAEVALLSRDAPSTRQIAGKGPRL